MKKDNKKFELLAPAGNLEKCKTAFLFGADAVYLGIPDYSLRVRINDFDLKKIKIAVENAHFLQKKVYVTINIFAHNRHFKNLSSYIKKLKDFKVDALIISDPGILSLVKEIWPKAEIHLSTQANCTNWQSAKFWQKQGVGRIILGRETTLNEIKEIHKRLPDLELEYFIHGAMCMAYSGRCFLSKYFLNRSGNLGDCVQPCRWNYKEKSLFISEEKRPNEILEIVEEEHGSYILNSKDLCLIKYLDKLAKAGISSFKIEGRAKSIYYIATVVGAYREAINEIGGKGLVKTKKINYLYKELKEKLMHRGYSAGFLLGDKGDQELNFSHTYSNWEFCGEVLESKKEKNAYLNLIKVHNSLKIGDTIEILKPIYDIIKLKPKKIIDAKTNNEIFEAHGGSGQKIIFKTKERLPTGSVLRRKLK